MFFIYRSEGSNTLPINSGMKHLDGLRLRQGSEAHAMYVAEGGEIKPRPTISNPY